ncbi:calcium-independent phospholipase a2-gamma [Diplodia corticola]|uniref:Calcium-independent phospholipase a2-gamma n=1 Tax=Diplodia corticola TaxID=236234 RepID=A0A1J9QQI0_9PEZI|nr:calcium-independent phospholipase a2-gamma [Diplodia corticola]OJD30282.1 calcium-independent phospholipase a2-gamma [Diplodia corticola]
MEATGSNIVAPGNSKPWAEYAVLTFDGGGIRGYASLLLLRGLMRAIERNEQDYSDYQDSSFQPIFQPQNTLNGSPGLPQPDDRPVWRRVSTLEPPPRRRSLERGESGEQHLQGFLPCHYFDYMFGTSTGGLNAIMLGRLRMSIDECISHYPALVKKIFSKPRAKMMGFRDRYNPKHLEEAIQTLVAEKSPRRPGRHTERRVVIAKEISADGTVERPYRFRTYNTSYLKGGRDNSGPADDFPIWKVARATSAAPGYFKEMKIDGRKYSDGAAGFNNPASLAIKELWKTVSDRDPFPIALLLSIGTGKEKADEEDCNTHKHRDSGSRKKRKVRGVFGSMARASMRPFIQPIGKARNRLSRAKYELTETEKIHEDVEFEMSKQRRPYYRLNGNEDVGALELDEWKEDTQSKIEKSIATELSNPETNRKIQECADCLKMKDHLKQNHSTVVDGMRKEQIFVLIEQECLFEDPVLEGGPY